MPQAVGRLMSRHSHTPATHTAPSTGIRTQGSSSKVPIWRAAMPRQPPTATPMRREMPCCTVWPRVLWVQMMQAMQA